MLRALLPVGFKYRPLVGVWYIFVMDSRILQQDRKDLIQLNRALSPQERLEAFYHHSRLLSQLSLARGAGKKNDAKSSFSNPPLSQE